MGRDPKHNYRSRCIYHITIGKAHGCPDFSRVYGTPEQPCVERSRIGAIVESQMLNLPNLCPSLQILQYVIMPDHIHFAVFAHDYLPKPIGSYIGMMKVKCGQLIRAEFPTVTDIFIRGFHDRYLRPTHRLSTIIEYINSNPRRLLVRRLNPDFFRRINNLNIFGVTWQAYGNLQLLDNPFKAPVVIHRSDSDDTLAAKHRRWKHVAENGGVLVSPFISPAEKAVRHQCEETAGKIILISNEPFGEREKPAAHDFNLCAEGRLLVIAPINRLSPGRETFLYLNSIAESISSHVFVKDVG
ncbi:MAG: hypothetical protein HDS91_00150 [Bacteroidales bacterium]|nr:hypothetical protein [Bacteroidales bacterium]